LHATKSLVFVASRHEQLIPGVAPLSLFQPIIQESITTFQWPAECKTNQARGVQVGQLAGPPGSTHSPPGYKAAFHHAQLQWLRCQDRDSQIRLSVPGTGFAPAPRTTLIPPCLHRPVTIGTLVLADLDDNHLLDTIVWVCSRL
jgi:hypothetical protein